MRVKTKTLPVFNGGRPLTVLRVPDGSFGVVDHDHFRVWIDDAMASAQVRAATPLAVLAIKHDDFQHLLDTHPDMAIQFYRHFAAEMARRLRASNERSE